MFILPEINQIILQIYKIKIIYTCRLDLIFILFIFRRKAMGKGQLKAQLHMQKFLVGINNNGRANFITRPLLVSVMEYSTAEVLQLMIHSGANLNEYYSG